MVDFYIIAKQTKDFYYLLPCFGSITTPIGERWPADVVESQLLTGKVYRLGDVLHRGNVTLADCPNCGAGTLAMDGKCLFCEAAR